MLLYEKDFTSPSGWSGAVFERLRRVTEKNLKAGEVAVRFVIPASTQRKVSCELGVLSGCRRETFPSIFDFVARPSKNGGPFNAVLLVPTGIGAEIGGHDGDAGPVSQLLASVCDRLITHPNVVNGADINELPANGLYVEGSIICRLLMGQIGLQPVRSNRVLVVLGTRKEDFFVHAAINSVNAARAAYGLQVSRIVLLDQEMSMKSVYAPSGRATGLVEGLQELVETLDAYRDEFDAVALTSAIDVDDDLRKAYYAGASGLVNPWGGVEAILTHAISLLYDKPAAHSPMYDNFEHAFRDYGVVDPRIAPEVISFTFLQCLLKGLQRTPKVVSDPQALHAPGVLTAADCSCLVIPDGCLGLPTLAALFQGIPVIAVRGNRNVLRNNIHALPWAPGQFFVVENYLEAAGVMNCLKAGIAPEAVQRPLHPAQVVETHATSYPTTVERGVAQNVPLPAVARLGRA